MGLLDKLWDDVVAGPQPERGLGRLRGKPRVSEELNAGPEELKRLTDRRRSGDFATEQEEARRVSQSIAIAKPPPLLIDSLDSEPGSTPSTPGAVRTPSSSFVGSPVFDKLPRSGSMPISPALGSPAARERENVWTTVFHPGSNKAMKKLGSQKFDKQAPNSPTVYDWLYSKDTKSTWR
ncbi:hypothetical protein GOP47_0020580 [Adiantum capillus-veneris]|uniref:Uncharacterized protein n=2 Tax=Adiantum capillus-veneris TaxID=13818 RepID=A0A9D4Z7K7_ADICA|nr:hypothetical protein GOP47_0020580 [Adiantum capillus-veneris]